MNQIRKNEAYDEVLNELSERIAVLQTKEPRPVNKTRFPFVIRNGGRTMVNRKKFEDYHNNSTSI